MIDPKKRRRFPRRKFERDIGVLVEGKYSVAKTIEIGEGGLMLALDSLPKDLSQIVVTFFVGKGHAGIIRSEVRYTKGIGGQKCHCGIQFQNLEFKTKRLIRDYISSKSVEEAEKMSVPDPDKVAFITQTTLSVDDTRAIVEALNRRFPNIVNPSKLDICYATQNRQDAVKELAKLADVIFIMGSPESSNSNRLVEVAKSCGVKEAYLIEGADNLDKNMFRDDTVVGLSSGASTPEAVVQELIDRLSEFGATSVEELGGKEEYTVFPFPESLEVTKDSIT